MIHLGGASISTPAHRAGDSGLNAESSDNFSFKSWELEHFHKKSCHGLKYFSSTLVYGTNVFNQ